MPNWVYNKLTVTGSKEGLLKFSKDIGTKDKPFDYSKIATLVENSWDSRDERDCGEVKKVKNQLVYKFQTAWGYRPKLIQDLSGIYKDLRFLIYYVEEGPAFVGATCFANGELTGEAFAEAGLELEEFFQKYDEDDLDSDEGEYDYEAMEAALVQSAEFGGRIDWKKREKEKQEREEKAKLSAVELFVYDIKEITKNPGKFPPLAKKTNKAIIDAVNQHTNIQTERDIAIKLLPEKYWNDDLVATFLLANHENAKNIKEKYCTKKVVDILLNDQRGYRGVWPLKKLKKGITEISQAKKLIQKSASSLELIPVELRTKEVCLSSLTKASTVAVLKFVPKELRDLKLCEIAVKGRGENLKFVPAKLKLQNICELAVKNDPRAIQYVPSSKINDELMQAALNHEYTWLSIELDDVKNKSMRIKYLRDIVRKSHLSSMRQMTNQEHEMLWGTSEGEKLLVELIETESLFRLEYLPIKYHSDVIVSKVAKFHAEENFVYLPDRLRTKKLSRKVIENITFDYVGAIFSKVPLAYRDAELCKIALNKQYEINKWAELDGLFERRFKHFADEIIEPEFKFNKYENELKETFVENFIPPELWEKDLKGFVEHSLKSSRFAQLFIPIQYVRQDVLSLLKESFYYFLCLSPEVQNDLIQECIEQLKVIVPEDRWSKLSPWQDISAESKNKTTLIEILKKLSLRWWKIDQIKSVIVCQESTLNELINIGAKDTQSNFIDIIKSFNINLEVAFTSNDEFLRFSLMFDFAFIDLFSKILMGAYRIGRRKALGDKY